VPLWHCDSLIRPDRSTNEDATAGAGGGVQKLWLTNLVRFFQHQEIEIHNRLGPGPIAEVFIP
jgi:hypothetical protein